MRKIIFLNMLLVGASGVFAHNTPADSVQEKDCLCGERDCPETNEEKDTKDKSQEELRESAGTK